MKYKHIHYEELTSTNTEAASLAKDGAAEYTTVTASAQSQGKGTKHRSFYSQGGLYMSVIIRPDDESNIKDTNLITLYTATCVCRTIKKFCRGKNNDVGIKWVNDIISPNGKVCGILCEAYFKPNENNIDYVIIGIGINIGRIDFPPQLENIAAYLDVSENKRIRIINKMRDHTVKLLSSYRKQLKTRKFLDDYRRNCIIVDKHITVHGDGEPYEAVVMGIDDDGGLMTVSRKGAKILRCGEVTVKITD